MLHHFLWIWCMWRSFESCTGMVVQHVHTLNLSAVAEKMLTMNNIITLHRKQGMISRKSYYNNSSIWLLLCPNAYSLKKNQFSSGCMFLFIMAVLLPLYKNIVMTELNSNLTSPWNQRGPAVWDKQINKRNIRHCCNYVGYFVILKFFSTNCLTWDARRVKTERSRFIFWCETRAKTPGKNLLFRQTKFGTNTHTQK